MTFVSLCGQDKVVTSRSKTVAVAVVVGKDLLQDMMLAVPDPFKQSFVQAELGEIEEWVQ